jgi:hypothetical protein
LFAAAMLAIIRSFELTGLHKVFGGYAVVDQFDLTVAPCSSAGLSGLTNRCRPDARID